MSRANFSDLFLSAWKSEEIKHSARTAIGAAASLAVARFLGMPEAYWAPITTIIVMQSTLGASWAISKSRFIGTILGTALGWLSATYFEPRVTVLGVAIFTLGLLCAVLSLAQRAYRFAGITFAIITLVTRAKAPWLIAVHRCVEVLLGITVALVLAALWPEHELPNGKKPREELS